MKKIILFTALCCFILTFSFNSSGKTNENDKEQSWKVIDDTISGRGYNISTGKIDDEPNVIIPDPDFYPVIAKWVVISILLAFMIISIFINKKRKKLPIKLKSKNR